MRSFSFFLVLCLYFSGSIFSGQALLFSFTSSFFFFILFAFTSFFSYFSSSSPLGVERIYKYSYRILPINSPPPKNSPTPIFLTLATPLTLPFYWPVLKRTIFLRKFHDCYPQWHHQGSLWRNYNFKEPHKLVKDTRNSGTNEWYCAFWSISIKVSYKTEKAGGEFQGGKNVMVNF